MICEQLECLQDLKRTTRKRALPRLEVFGYLGHLDVGIEFLDLVHYGVLVVVCVIVIPPLLSLKVTS
jgi:hypothetical protein